MRTTSDVVNSSYVIVLCGFVLSFALSWGWIITLQYFVSFVVWTTIVVFYIVWVAMTIVLYMKAGWLTVRCYFSLSSLSIDKPKNQIASLLSLRLYPVPLLAHAAPHPLTPCRLLTTDR